LSGNFIIIIAGRQKFRSGDLSVHRCLGKVSGLSGKALTFFDDENIIIKEGESLGVGGQGAVNRQRSAEHL